MGKCSLQFFPRNIHFRIECKGELEKDEKNKFQIDIIFPFRKANLKIYSSSIIILCSLC